jgi:hypothetical protein
MLGGWLHRHTCFAASKLMRAERRRQFWERQAIEMNALNSSDGDFEHLAPVLDEVINELPEDDRTAILLRFYERRDLRSVGEALGSSENAAQKRVTRALGQLHLMLARRGIVFSVAALSTALAAQAVTVAPTGVGAAIAAAALSGTSSTTATVIAATKAITMTTLQKAAVTVTFAIVVGAGIQQAYRAWQLRDQVQALQKQQIPLAEQIQQLQRERDEATNRLALLTGEKSHDGELLKLRAEVTALGQTARERATTESTVERWATRIASLKQSLDQMPDRRIPEMEFLTEKDWAAAARNADLSTDDGVRQAMQALRSAAKDNFLNLLRDAIRKYAAAANGGDMPGDPAQFARAVNANGGLLPSNLAQLKPYFDVPVDDALLDRYQFQHPQKLHDNLSDIIVTEVASPVDAEFDTYHEIGLNSGGVRPVNLVENAVAAAAKEYARANNGQMPSEPAQIAPYLKSPLDAALAQKYLSKPSTAVVQGK